MGRQTKLRHEAVIRAYQNDLGQGEREEVDFLADELDSHMENLAPHVRFSHHMAVELLGSIGILMCHVEEAQQVISHG
jgi:hypothetical protein